MSKSSKSNEKNKLNKAKSSNDKLSHSSADDDSAPSKSKKSKQGGLDLNAKHSVDNKSKKSAKAKKNKKSDEDELDTDLIEDDGSAGEDLPDLEEFDGDSDEDVDSDDDSVDETQIEISEMTEVTILNANQDGEEEVILTDAEGRRLCRVRDCDQAATVEAYCRFHYLQNWKKIQVRRKILADGKLERYVDELTSRYPDKFLEMIRKDLRSEKDFVAAIAELEIDESGLDNDYEDDNQNFIDEVRGVTESASLSSDDDEY